MSDGEIALRLCLALLFGALVGVERQWHHKTAGVKTHTLVALGAATFALASQLGLGAGSNPVQIAAGIVTGIGFIGGGVIMRRGSSVQGINTAATIWATGSLGLALGGGHYTLGVIAFLAIVTSQFLLRGIGFWIDSHAPAAATVDCRLAVSLAPDSEGAVRAIVDAFAVRPGVAMTAHGETRATGEVALEARFALPQRAIDDLAELGRKLAAIPGVARVEWGRATGEERD